MPHVAGQEGWKCYRMSDMPILVLPLLARYYVIKATSALSSTLVDPLAGSPCEGSGPDRAIVRAFQPRTQFR